MDNFEFDELDEELVTDTGHSTSGEGLAKIRSLAAAVASSDKYQEDTNSFSRKSLKPPKLMLLMEAGLELVLLTNTSAGLRLVLSYPNDIPDN